MKSSVARSMLHRNIAGIANQAVTGVAAARIAQSRSFKCWQSALRPPAPPGLIMECTINWIPASGMGFVAETGSGHLLTMDGAPDGGGRNLAPRPMETVLAGTGACTAYDVVMILKRGRHDVTGCQVKVSSERAAADPKVFTRIHMHFIVTGAGLPDAAVQRAVQMSHEKYCSASIMLAKTADITSSFEVVPG